MFQIHLKDQVGKHPTSRKRAKQYPWPIHGPSILLSKSIHRQVPLVVMWPWLWRCCKAFSPLVLWENLISITWMITWGPLVFRSSLHFIWDSSIQDSDLTYLPGWRMVVSPKIGQTFSISHYRLTVKKEPSRLPINPTTYLDFCWSSNF